MGNSKEKLTEEEIKKMAYLAALRFRHAGLDAETIYARLEKQGIPESIAKQVARDVMSQKKREIVEQAKGDYNFALIRIGVALILALISVLVMPGNFILPIGILAGGIVAALLAKKKIEE